MVDVCVAEALDGPGEALDGDAAPAGVVDVEIGGVPGVGMLAAVWLGPPDDAGPVPFTCPPPCAAPDGVAACAPPPAAPLVDETEAAPFSQPLGAV